MKCTRTVMYSNSRLLRLQVNDVHSTFISFYTLFEKAGVVSTINDVAFLCETTIQEDNTTDTNILDQNQSSESIFRLRHYLQLMGNGHCKIVILTSVDVDIHYIVPFYSFWLKNGLTTSVTKEYLIHLNEDWLLFIPITCVEIQNKLIILTPRLSKHFYTLNHQHHC